MRIVLDTNILIDSLQDDHSAAHRLIDAAAAGKITAVASKQVRGEYERILQRFTAQVPPAHVSKFLKSVELIEASAAQNVILDDEEDRKLLEAAVGGRAHVLVTQDRHLLDVGEIGETRIMRADEAWRMVEEVDDGEGEWQAFVKGVGIAR